MWNSAILILDQLISIRWKWILCMENPRFWNPASVKSNRLPLLPHTFDNVRGLHPSQFSTDSNDQTGRQSVMLNVFSSSSIKVALPVTIMFDASFFHYGIALHFTEKINCIICSARAVYESTHDVSSLHGAKHAFLIQSKISNKNVHRQHNFSPREFIFPSYLDEEAVSGEKLTIKEQESNKRTYCLLCLVSISSTTEGN